MLNNLLKISSKHFTKQSHKNLDTIFALASGVNTAISIIRVSGSQAYKSLQLLNKNNSNNNSHQILNKNILNIHKIEPRKAHYKNIYNSSGNLIDQCIILYFPQKYSYNNQQIIQFHIHGSKAIVNRFRIAERGQFTKRALLNGKLNMIQAQSINDLIKSQNQFQRQIAINNMLGKGKQFLENVKKQLIKCLANNQAYIDFQQDESDVKADLFVKNKDIVKNVLKNIYKILQNYKNLQILKQGINITILGKPNVGKSTLINALAKKQIAIVSQQPGTTRDILQTQIQCGGVRINLYDTAGLRSTGNKIESQGIRRAKLKIKESQINLLIIDLSQEQLKEHITTNNQKQIQIVNKFNMESKVQKQETNYNELIDKNTILIINKGDKLQPSRKQNMKYYINVKKLIPKQQQKWLSQDQQKIIQPQPDKYQQFKKYSDLIISAQNPQQVNKLISYLQSKIKQQYSLYQTSQQIYFTRQRFFNKLQKCVQYLQKYQIQERPDIACQYLRESIQEISQMFGKVDVQDVLDVLFKQFCIGK